MKVATKLLALSALLALCVALSLSLGVSRPSLIGAYTNPDGLDRAIFFARASRVILSAVAGGALAMVGASFQALLRNPLGDPYALGVSGGGALGATVAVVLGAGGLLVPASAFLGATLAMLVVLLAGRSQGHRSAQTLLLAGLVVNACSNAALVFLRSIVSAEKAQETLSILLGYVSEERGGTVGSVAILCAIGAVGLMALAKPMNLLAAGEETAASLGVEVAGVERMIFLASSLVVAAVVSVCGLIPFVGLIVPHYARALMGADHRAVLPACVLGGASLLVLADLGTRMIFLWLGSEPPVGALTALVGAPFFLVVLRQGQPEGDG